MKRVFTVGVVLLAVLTLLACPVWALTHLDNEQAEKPSTQEQTAVKGTAIDPCQPQAKAYILDGMLNSTAYFSSVQGSFRTSLISGDSDEVTTVNYVIDTANQNSYEAVLDECNNLENYTISGVHYAFQNTTQAAERTSGGVYARISREDQPGILTARTTSSAISVMEDGTKAYQYPMDYSQTQFARISICPQELAFGLLGDETLWDVERTDTFLGRACLVVSGVAEQNYGSKLGFSSFEMWIDEGTGILLQFYGYDESGKISQFIKTDQIAVDAAATAGAISARIEEAVERYPSETAK